MPIRPPSGGKLKPSDSKPSASEELDLDDEDNIFKRDDGVSAESYDDDEGDAESVASAFKVGRKPERKSHVPPPPPMVPVDDDSDEDDLDDEDDDGGTPRVAPAKSKKGVIGKSKSGGSGLNGKMIAIVLVIVLVVGGGGFAVWKFVLPSLSGAGNVSANAITLVAPQDFMALGASQPLQASLDTLGYSLSSFVADSRTVARASGLSQNTSALVVTTLDALNKHAGDGVQNVAAYNTPLVFAMKRQTANELKEYGVITDDAEDGSLIMNVDKLMIEVARGAPYKLSGPDLLNSDMGNLLWCLMNNAIAASGLDEQVQLAVLNNIRVSMGVEAVGTSDIFRSLSNDTSERRVVAVPESSVITGSGTMPDAWVDTSQNSLVVAYPKQSAVLTYHVVTYNENGAAWFTELGKINAESLFNDYGLRLATLEAPHLGTSRLQAGLKQKVNADSVMPSVDRFKELISMLG